MLKVNPIKKITATEQIMEQIAQMITSGSLKPGEKLPNERLLAEQFGVARGRIREAFRALSLIGLITIKAGEGSFINSREQPIPPDTISWMFHNEIHNLAEIYDARKLIESAAYLSAVTHASDQQLKQLHSMLQQLQSYDHPVDFSPSEFLQMLDQLDMYIGEICGNQIYYKLMQTIIHLRRDSMTRLLHVPGTPISSIQTRTKLINALKTRDPAKVQAALDHFFQRAKAFYTSFLEG
jgi:DNA-binding FadR family transcriptional regulator